jgi:diguanylate cyclase (GGDEF)-like protein
MQRNVLRPARKDLALENGAEAAGRVPAAGSKSHRRVLAIDRAVEGHDRPMSSAPWMEKSLASALLAQDRTLEQILREVDGLAKAFRKSDSPDAQALSGVLRRTVLCAVKQSLLDRELRSLALTDDLTSLYNRRAFFALATQQLKVMRRRGRGLLLFFADVDHLKNINDTYGHREGDLALVRTAQALGQTFRDSDIVARLSGDEFAVLALEASSGDQDAILRRLEDKLAEVSAEEDRYKLSVSVGMVRFDPKHDLMLGELLSKADEAMYAEKKNHPKSWIATTR